MVGLAADRAEARSAARSYKILRLLPQSDGEPRYGLKTIRERCERIAQESELSLEPQHGGGTLAWPMRRR